MKFRVTFKDPDGPSTCFEEEAKRQVHAIEGVDDDERDDLVRSHTDKLAEFAAKWLKYGECVTIEFDTDAGTAVVVPA